MTKVKILIDNTGLKQKFIADKIGYHQIYLSEFVNGWQPIKPEIGKKLAKFLGCKVVDIIQLDGMAVESENS